MELMPDNIDAIFHEELNPGERIIWKGQPQQGLVLRGADGFLIPFSLLWGGFAIFWESMVIAGGAPFFFWLWGIPFVLIGLYIIAGRFVVDAQLRKKTYYALTNERVIIISGLINQNTKSIYLKTLSEVNLTRKSSGRGTITFGALSPISFFNAGGGWPMSQRYHAAPSFEMVEDANHVYQQIKRVQRESI